MVQARGVESAGNLRDPIAEASSSDRGREPGSDVDLVKGPAGHRCWSAAAVPHIDVAQRDAESRADALDIRLFASPALKESRQALRRRQGRQRALLGR
jgi:hypothetical protein